MSKLGGVYFTHKLKKTSPIKTVAPRVDLMASGPPKVTPRNLFEFYSRPSISPREAGTAA